MAETRDQQFLIPLVRTLALLIAFSVVVLPRPTIADGPKDPPQGIGDRLLKELLKRIRHPGEEEYRHAWSLYQKGENEEAFKWFLKSAEIGFDEGQIQVAYFYANGIGVTKDYTLAAYWDGEAAAQGNPKGMYNLGLAHMLGKLGKPNYEAANEWFMKAAKLGHAYAQYNLARNFDEGRGTEKNLGEAARWYRESAKQGFAEGQYALAIFYANGWGVPQDYKMALEWTLKAARQGLVSAQANAGVLLQGGWGTAPDPCAAAKWFGMAAQQGSKRARDELKKIREHADCDSDPVLQRKIRSSGASLVRPTLRDRPDRDICKTLVYQNPDHIKEAERRGLTEEKCQAILGN